VFERLRNLARERGTDVNALLVQYAVERLLYRVSESGYGDQFILNGAMLFRLWMGSLHRPTQDVDLLGFGDAQPDQLIATFQKILRAFDDPQDGITYDSDAITATEIRDGQDYPGVRMRIPALLGNARVVVRVDVGFGDAVTPEAQIHEFPTLLGHEAPHIRAYPQETSIAEKLEAIASIGLVNSRMKDYYDILIMSQRFAFDGQTLVNAIRATFERRNTPIPGGLPEGLGDEFANDAMKQAQWKAFIKRSQLTDAPEELPGAVHLIRLFLEQPLLAASSGDLFAYKWNTTQGWIGRHE